MKKQTKIKVQFIGCLMALLAFSTLHLFSQPNTWVQKANYGGGSIFSGVGFSIGDKGYIGLGDNGFGTQYQSIWEYDPSTDVWTQKANFGGGTRSNAVAFSIGGKAYVGTGYNSVAQKDFWEYDQASNNWTQKADFAGGNRIRMVGFSIGSKGYVGTGNNGTFQKDFWEYDPSSDTWTALSDFPGLPRQSATGFSIGTKGYLGTGWGASANFKDFWEYNPATNAWLQKSDAGTTNRYEAVGFSIGTKGYIGTGGEWPVYTKDLLEYDPSIDCWTKRADVGGGVRALASGFSVGGKGYIGTSQFQIDFWEYTPAPSLPPPTIDSFTPASGSVGTTITITGTNFDTNATGNIVRFNGTAAVVSASTATSLTAIVPNAATTGTISVQTGCTTATSTTNFTVTPYVPFGNIIQFNGTTDRIRVSDHPALRPTSLTVEFWVNFNATPAVLLGKPYGGATQGAYQFWYEAGRINSGVNAFSVASGIGQNFTPVLGQWYHLALTYNDITKDQKLYLNGSVIASGIGTTPIYDSKDLLIGADIDFSTVTNFFNGKIDEVRLWNVDRTQTEILSTINSTLTGNEPNLAAYYKMDEVGQGAGITAVNSATATGATLNGTTVGTTCTPIFTILNAPTITSFSPAFGNTGASITITGINFDPTPANNIVQFNGATAVVTASTATNITVTVPAGGSTGLISVQVGCNTATSTTNFIVPVCFPASGQNADIVLGQTNFTSNTSGGGNNKFAGVGSVAIHHATGKVFVADIGNNRILRFSASQANTLGGIAEAVIGQPDFTTISPGLSASKLNLPIAITIDQSSGALWVADANNNRILRFDNAVTLPNGASASGVLGQSGFTTNAATPSAVNVGFPWGVALDVNGDLWVGERAWNRVTKFPNAASLPNGAAATVVIGQINFTSTSIGTSASTLWRPNNVAVDPSGNLWVADELNDRVLKFPNAASLTTGASATTVLGQIDFFGNSFATAQNRMYGPIGMHADIFGNLWVGDWANQRVLQFVNAASLTNGANASKVLGAPNFTAIFGGTAQNRTGVVPGVAVDNFGNVFVADDANRRVLRFNAPIATATAASACLNTTATLMATGAVALQEYRWYDAPTGGTSLGSAASFTTPPLTATTTYYVSLFDGGCSYESLRTPVVVTVNALPPAPTITSSKIPVNGTVLLCTENNETTMLATSPAGFTGYKWSNGQTVPSFSTNQSGSISVRVTDGSGCQSVASAALIINSTPCKPTIVTATFNTTTGGTVSQSVLSLITVVGTLNPSSLKIITQPASGAIASIAANGLLTVNYSGIQFVGTESLTIEACDTNGICATQTIKIEVAGDIVVFNAISPNGDAFNPEITLENIQLFPDTKENRVSIYNRWGEMIFETENYDNSNRVFRGVNSSGDALPIGTYYYQIKFVSGRKEMTGFIALKK